MRAARDKVKEYEEKIRKDEKRAIIMQERVVKLEEQNRELMKGKIHNPNKDLEEDLKYGLLPPNLLNLDYKLQEATRINAILLKSRDALAKSLKD